MIRSNKMCESCPFHLKMTREERAELAALQPEEFPCHTEAGYTTTDIQCRGHWEVRRKQLNALSTSGPKPLSTGYVNPRGESCRIGVVL